MVPHPPPNMILRLRQVRDARVLRAVEGALLRALCGGLQRAITKWGLAVWLSGSNRVAERAHEALEQLEKVQLKLRCRLASASVELPP